ncbi:MAG: ATP/GTP-binding protein [Myxococcota bacterium]
MAHVNQHTREVSANIVYYGPAGSGKTASLEHIHGKLRSNLRGRLTRVPTQIDPTVSYELLPVELGEIKGMSTKFEIASVPGDPIHRAMRKSILRDVDGIVFVADSRPEGLEANVESLKDLEENLAAYGRSLADVPMIFHWNRSDAPDALDQEELERRFNEGGARSFRTVATDGTGILEGLTTIAKLILRRLRASTSKAGSAAASGGEQKAQEKAPRVRARIAEPAPLAEAGADPGVAEGTAEALPEIEPVSEPEPESGAGDAIDLGEPVVQEAEGDDTLPEALLEELGEEMPDLDLPIEPLQEGAAGEEGLDALESGFQPIDFTTEVTDLAERGDLDEEWEIAAVGTPTRLGPATFSIPLEIREGGHPAREVEITISLSGLARKKK